MKKTFAILFLISFLFGLMAPTIILAALEGPLDHCKLRYDLSADIDATCTAGKTVSATSTPAWGLCCIINTIYRVTDIIFYLLIAAVIILVLVGAYTFLTAGGSPENVRKGQNYILFALLALVIAFLSKAIASLIKLLV